MSQSLADRSDVNARFQKFDGVSMPEVVRTALDACFLEHPTIKFLEIRRRILSRSVLSPKEEFGIAVLDLEKFLAQPSRDDVVDEH